MTKDLAEVRRLGIKLGYLNEDGTPGWKSRELGWADAGGWSQSSRDLAIKAGYLNEAGTHGRDALCLTTTPPERLAELRAQGFNPVFDDPFNLEGQSVARIVTDPDTGVRSYIAAREPYVYAAASSVTGSPPSIMERPRNYWLNGSTEIDRFSLSPGRDSVLQQLNEADLVGGVAGAPEMFGTGPLPRFTASGIDPGELRWCAWQLRTSCAFTDSRAHALEMIMASQELALDETLQTPIGRDHLNSYFANVQSWANMVPEGAEGLQGLSVESIKRLYPDGPGE
jgi:hypothetical protein